MGIRKKWKDFAPGLMFALLCIVDWYTSNSPLLDMYSEKYLTRKELFFHMLQPVAGYEAYNKWVLIYVLCFFVFYEHFSVKEKTYLLLREKSRISYCKRKVKGIAETAVLFVLIREFINWCGMLSVFTLEEIINSSFFQAVFFHIFSQIIFYIQAGIFFETVYVYLKKSLTMILCFLVYVVQYYTFVIVHPKRLLMYDVLNLPRILEGNMKMLDMVVIYGRNIAIMYILWLCFCHFFERKDIYHCE